MVTHTHQCSTSCSPLHHAFEKAVVKGRNTRSTESLTRVGTVDTCNTSSCGRVTPCLMPHGNHQKIYPMSDATWETMIFISDIPTNNLRRRRKRGDNVKIRTLDMTTLFKCNVLTNIPHIQLHIVLPCTF